MAYLTNENRAPEDIKAMCFPKKREKKERKKDMFFITKEENTTHF